MKDYCLFVHVKSFESNAVRGGATGCGGATPPRTENHECIRQI